jgi:hypothetical protein
LASKWPTRSTPPTPVTKGERDGAPSCSPDGKWFAYADNPHIYKVPIEGGPPTQLGENSFGGVAAISPDVKLIAYSASGAAPISPNVRTIIPSAGGAPVSTSSVVAGGGMGQWAPDSRAMDYLLTRGGVSNIWRQPLAGGPPTQVTNFSSGLIFGFSWSRDGKQLALARGSRTSDIILISNFH